MLLLIARCSGSDEIHLDRAEQSSTLTSDHNEFSSSTFIAANAIDADLNTESATTEENPAWWRVYFTSSSTVERVMVEKGYCRGADCVFTVSVYDGEVQTVCGTYTGKLG